MRKGLFLFASVLLLTSCLRVGEEIEPQINVAVQDRYLKSLPPPFPPPPEKQSHEPWCVEERIGLGFAKELDLYQAMTAFKRASFLVSERDLAHQLQLHYDVMLAYYWGAKYGDVIYTYETSSLSSTDPRFIPYHDMLVMLYDAHFQLHHTEQSEAILQYLASQYPQTADKLALFNLLYRGDVMGLEHQLSSHPELHTVLDPYLLGKKSARTAQMLNVVPGAGYLYLGQTQSAITAALLNALFIWASVYSFQHGHTAAGIIFATVEAGWYFGGIYGAGQEAKLYNERLYEKHATPFMNANGYFPILMLKYGF